MTVGSEELQPVFVHPVHAVLASDEGQEFVHDDPLVVPAHDLLGLGEQRVDDLIVKLDERQVHVVEKQVLVIAWVPDQRHAR